MAARDNTTLIIHWVFSWLALLVMAARLIWRKIAKQRYMLGDYFTMGAIVCALARLALIHVVLIWGTSNISDAYRQMHEFTETEIYQRTIGSQLSLANRVFYNSYLWLQKLVLLDLYRQLLRDLPHEKMIIRTYLLVFFASYVAIQVLTFSECNPVSLYWQIVPDPGHCAKAQVQLITLGILNVVTDTMLIVLPMPVVIKLQAPWRRKAQLVSLFTLGIFIIVITIVRLPINSMNKDSQVSRTTWASIELLTSALVVNAPALYGLMNNHRRQRSQASQRYRTGGSEGINSRPKQLVTIGGTDSYQMETEPGAKSGITKTTEVTVEGLRESRSRQSRDSARSPADSDGASRPSSQRQILHE